MKIAITTTGNSLDAPLDKRFGRAEKFVIVDGDNGAYTVVDNIQNLNVAQGAGIQAAQTVAGTGAEALITGHCGPKAFRVLEQCGIKIYASSAGTVGKALNQFRGGELTAAAGANVEGHWS